LRPVPRRFAIVVCRGPECGDKRNSRAVHAAFERELVTRGLNDRCTLEWQSCFGRCSQGPNVLVREVPSAPTTPRFTLADLPATRGGGVRMATALYNRMAPVNAAEVVESHVQRFAIVSRLIERLPGVQSLPVVVRTAAPPPPEPVSDDTTDTIVCEVSPDVPTP
jgi:(2Fe-2S) ferredoxin